MIINTVVKLNFEFTIPLMSEYLKLPNLIDLHVHCRDFGQSHKETYHTASMAALAGGITFIGDMPNNSELTDSLKKIDIKKEMVKDEKVDFGFYLGTLGDEKQNFKECFDHVLGLKVYMSNTTGGYIVSDENRLNHIFKSWECEKPILVHAEGNTLLTAIELAEKYDRKLYVCHVSRKDEVELIVNAKNKRPDMIFAEVTPHHLFLDADSVKNNPYRQMKPPLSEPEDIKSLWIAVQDGTIDTIGSDHAPHTKEEKKSDNPPFGVPGLETTLILLLKAQRDGIITRNQIIKLTHDNPIKIFNLEEQEDTFVTVERGVPNIIRGENLKTKCRWSPFEGMEFSDRVLEVTLRGKVVYNRKNL